MHKPFVCAALLALATSAFAADFNGTWKLNTHKSKGPEQAREAQLVAADEDGAHVTTVTGTLADGSPMTTKFSFPAKGGPGTIIDGAAFTSVTARRVTASTEDFLFSKDGKPAMHIHSVLSPDGKTMTTTRKVISGPQKPGTYTDVWERQ